MSPVTYFILAIIPLTGIFGIHDFYAQKYFRASIHIIGAIFAFFYSLGMGGYSIMMFFLFGMYSYAFAFIEGIVTLIVYSSKNQKDDTSIKPNISSAMASNENGSTTTSNITSSAIVSKENGPQTPEKVGIVTFGISAILVLVWFFLCTKMKAISGLETNLLLAGMVAVSAVGSYITSKKRSAIFAMNFYLMIAEIVALVVFLTSIIIM